MGERSGISEDVLIALRRISRAIDQHSRQLAVTHGLTGPQALLLTEIARKPGITGGELASRVSLSPATVTDVIKRLERRGLLERQRSSGDRRRVILRATDAGSGLAKQSVPLLQECFVQRLESLRDWEQLQLLSALQRIAAMMNAEGLDASPLLTSGAITASAEAIENVTMPPVERNDDEAND